MRQRNLPNCLQFYDRTLRVDSGNGGHERDERKRERERCVSQSSKVQQFHGKYLSDQFEIANVCATRVHKGDPRHAEDDGTASTDCAPCTFDLRHTAYTTTTSPGKSACTGHQHAYLGPAITRNESYSDYKKLNPFAMRTYIRTECTGIDNQ